MRNLLRWIIIIATVGFGIWFAIFSASIINSEGLIPDRGIQLSYSEFMVYMGITASIILIVCFGSLLISLTYPSEEKGIQKRLRNRSKNIYKFKRNGQQIDDIQRGRWQGV